VAFCDQLASHGLRAAALNLSVGWPANHGEGTAPDWGPYAPLADAIKRGNHVLVVHEYWDERGPWFNEGWWCNRIKHCPYYIPIIIGECGIDKYVADASVSPEMRGWMGWMNAQAYASQVREYCAMMEQDVRIQGVCLYTTDFGHPWDSFDTYPAQWELEQVFVEAKDWEDAGSPTTGPSTPAPEPAPDDICAELASIILQLIALAAKCKEQG
jgi:hypothetical protein